MLGKRRTTSLTVFTFLISPSSLEIQQREQRQGRITLRQQATLTLENQRAWQPEPPTFLVSCISPSKSNPPAPRHGEGPTHDQVGHPPGLPDRGQPAGQEEPAGALCQLHPHPHLPASHLHHRPAEQLRKRRRSRRRLCVDQGSAEIWGLTIGFTAMIPSPYVSRILFDSSDAGTRRSNQSM